MRILHTFSNWKWTGPAEPAVRLAAELARCHSVLFACGRCPYPDLENLVLREAERSGLDVLSGLRLRKHFDPLSGSRDLARLTREIRDREFEVVHAHLLNDHLLAGAAARRARKGAIIVRTVYGGPDLAPRIRSRLAFGRLCDGVIAASESAAAVVRSKTDLPVERLFVIPGAVDTDRFSPDRLAPRRIAARAEFGFSDDVVVGGIVARIQRHRRFELLLEAFAQATAREDRLRLLLIGRGTHADEIVAEPLRRLGLEDRVILTGYREGDEFVALLAALDFGLFLVPGSDGSCRAARELAACSLPLIVTRRPPLPEIVEHDVTGFALQEDSQEFAEALVRLARDDALREAMGDAARQRAERFFSLGRMRREVESAYDDLLQLGPRRRR